jgi:hypothetical protein
MSQEIQVVFDNGVFRAADPTIVPQPGDSFVIVKSLSKGSAADDAEELGQQRAALKRLFDQAESLPLEVADDGFSGADHDAALYGDHR